MAAFGYFLQGYHAGKYQLSRPEDDSCPTATKKFNAANPGAIATATSTGPAGYTYTSTDQFQVYD